MKQYLLLAASAFLLQGCQTSKEDIKEQPLKMIEQIDFSHVKINDNFWSPRLSKHVSATLPVCIDQIENQTGRIRNFENAAKGEGEHSGIFFDDSDVYKALEGMAYSLINNPIPSWKRKRTNGLTNSLPPNNRMATSIPSIHSPDWINGGPIWTSMRCTAPDI